MRPRNVRFGSKADMCSATRYVRFVPIADIQVLVSPKEKPREIAPRVFVFHTGASNHSLWPRIAMDYFGASGPTNLRPLGPVPLTWTTVGSRIST